ncbi:MAG: cobaltochelatase subunit CobN [Porphyromonadaceae bacterium]|nr:cobaltochelatase subunit CobN [Porphyromonadaceae bacterium]
MSKKRIAITSLSLLLLLLPMGGWWRWGSDTRIALVNFPGFQASGIALSNSSSHVRYDQLSKDDVERFEDYDCVLIFGMGLSWDEAQMAKVTDLTERGFPLQVVYATTPENNIMGLDSVQGARIVEYLDSGNKANYQNLALYIRKYVDRKKWFAPEPADKVEGAIDVFYHLDDRVAYHNKEEFDNYLKREGFYHQGAPNVLVIGGLTDPYSGSRENLDSLILHLHTSRLNVYPVSSFGKRLDFLKAVAPDIVVYLAHGRFQAGQGDKTVEYLKELNVPILAPVTIMQSREDWRKNPMGMVGGFMSQTIVMPELDGAVYPYAIFTQETNEDGYTVMKAMPDRLKTFTSIIHKFIALRKKSNAEKKLAIYFFKGPGQDMLAAQGLETTASLYNTLLHLKATGYNVEGLPNNLADFQRELARQGQIFKPYAVGQMQDFVDEVNPALISGEELSQWIQTSLSSELQDQLLHDYGDAPGEYMVVTKKQKPHLIVSRLRYGNVALLPQPMAGLGTDHFAVVHGANMPPPYPYVGAYLWAHHVFEADAIMHFGTHGSLEFTPQKQVALGNTDWGDQLVGDIPHFYYYTIGNIGESMMAKRRSYATTISYITPPFSRSGARGVYANLQTAIRLYYESNTPRDRDKHSLRVKRLAMDLGIHRELRMDSIVTKPYTEEDIERIDNFAEEIAAEKINGSLFITGEAYSPERLKTTVVAMSSDPIAYAKAKLDGLRDKRNYTQNKRTFHQKYLKPANALVERLLSGQKADDAIVLTYLGINANELERAQELIKQQTTSGVSSRIKDNKLPLAKSNKKISGGHPAWIPKIGSRPKPNKQDTKLEENKGAQVEATSQATPLRTSNPEDTTTLPGGKVSDIMTRHRASGRSTNEQLPSADEYAWAELVIEAKQAIQNIHRYQEALRLSPRAELDALVNALAGGYIAPSSGGDAVANPRAVPTGRNLYSISAEATPSERAWSKGMALARETLKEYQKRHGKYPTKVSYTFWSSEFIESEGASIAQVLYMLGVEPIRDSFGRVSDLRLIPANELGRPRIDVVIQTSGQFRDLAASRLALITEAIELAASAKDEEDNYVADGSLHTEKLLVEAGLSPKEARRLSSRRIFGGINGMYGTGIQEMITAGDKWESEQEIAEVYLNNMGASYATIEEWGEFSKPLFRAALANTDVVIQPRQSNTWGALSLDHVYEFMGGLNLSVRQVTGKDPDAFFADYRNRNNFKMQDLKEAIGIESRSTILNPEFVKEMLKGGESSLGRLVEITTNTYGWDVAKPEVIEEALWREIYQIYIEDKLGLDILKAYERLNPKAMQEVTAVMLETIRKGMWRATEAEIHKLVATHAELTAKFGATGGGMTSSNLKLQDFIAQHLSPEQAKEYQARQQDIRAVSQTESKNGVIMSKEQKTLQMKTDDKGFNGMLVAITTAVLFGGLVLVLRRKRQSKR